METADGFAEDDCRLLEEAREQDCKAMNGLTARTLQTTKEYQQFKTAGTEGITGSDYGTGGGELSGICPVYPKWNPSA